MTWNAKMLVIVTAVGALASAGCAGVTVERDAVLGWTTTRMTRNAIGGVVPLRTTLVINGLRREGDGGPTLYGFYVQTLASDWVFHGSLSFRVDGELLQFTDHTDLGDNVDCSGVRCTHDERSLFAATAEDIRKIARGKVVIARLGGRSGFIERTFSDTNLSRFQDFVEQYVGW